MQKLGTNFQTSKITKAEFERSKANLQKTFLQDSQIVSYYTPQFNFAKDQTDDEIRKSVVVKVLSLNWIYMGELKNKEVDLFNIFRNNIDVLKGSVLLDIIFMTFWSAQQRLIINYCFYPWLFYFFVA